MNTDRVSGWKATKSGSPQMALGLLWRSFINILPLAARELKTWRQRAMRIPDPELRRQALASLQKKRFHAEGGCVFAALQPGAAVHVVPFIVAIQTISDYLDNLCDRSTSLSGEDFFSLHMAMEDAVTPGAPIRNYYAHRREQADNHYLASLVKSAQSHFVELPGHMAVTDRILRHIRRYNAMQTFKHIHPTERVASLRAWHEQAGEWADLPWWEYAAASGSTLGVFALCAEAARDEAPDAPRIETLDEAYFPWIGGLHILLDYFIDQEEDVAGGDLNFVAQYHSLNEATDRLALFAREARERALSLCDGPFHKMVVAGLLGMYLSDEKVKAQDFTDLTKTLLRENGPPAPLFHGASRLYRFVVRHR